MNTIATPSSLRDLIWPEEKPAVASKDDNMLSQEDFFAMLTQQLAYQDPTKPVDNDQMVAQMTSFTMADGISQLNTNFNSFAESMTSNQALQASSLIGQEVLIEGNQGYLADATGVSGTVVTQATVQDLTIEVKDRFGATVRVINAGTQSPGNVDFQWDGKDSAGNQMPPGDYSFSAVGLVNGDGVQLPTAINRQVNSISLAGNSQGVILNLVGNVSIQLKDVIQIGKS